MTASTPDSRMSANGSVHVARDAARPGGLGEHGRIRVAERGDRGVGAPGHAGQMIGERDAARSDERDLGRHAAFYIT